jgi:catechol-2,3-dioxygenase
VPDKRALADAYFALTEAGVDVGPVDHLISWAIYFNDPDGNELEFYCDTRTDQYGTTLWHGRNLPLTEQQLRAALEEQDEVSTDAEAPQELA